MQSQYSSPYSPYLANPTTTPPPGTPGVVPPIPGLDAFNNAVNTVANNPGNGTYDWTNPAYGGSPEKAMAGYFGDAGQSTGQALVDQANQALNLQSGNSFAWRAISGAPGGGVYEVPGGGYFALGPDGTWGYNAGDSSGSGGGGSASGGGGAYVPGQGAPGQGTIFDPATNPQTAQQNAFEQYLMSELGPNSTNPAFSTDPNSPIIANQVSAYNTTQQQGVRNTLSQEAEAGGGTPQNLDAETRSLGEAAGQATAGFQAQLMGQQLQARQQEIQQVLTQYGSQLTQEQQMQLTEELAQLQNQLTAFGLTTAANPQPAAAPTAGG